MRLVSILYWCTIACVIIVNACHKGIVALGVCICLAQFENLKIALRQFLEIFNSCVNLQIAQGIAHKNLQCIQWFIVIVYTTPVYMKQEVSNSQIRHREQVNCYQFSC